MEGNTLSSRTPEGSGRWSRFGYGTSALGGRKRLLLLWTLMTVSCFVVASISIATLYRTAVGTFENQLVELVKSHAHLIDAIARFDAEHVATFHDYPEGAELATLSKIQDAFSHYPGFGRSGEFTFGILEEGQIVFPVRPRLFTSREDPAVPFDGELAEPMRQALLDQSGTLIGLDYRGQQVLAAYEPISFLNAGIVAKVDISEVKEPFIAAGISAAIASLLVVSAGALLFFRLSNPMIRRLERHSQELEREINDRKQAETALRESHSLLEAVVDGTPDLIFAKDREGRYLLVNGATLEFMNRESADEVLGFDDTKLYPERVAEHLMQDDREIMDSGRSRSFEETLHLSRGAATFLTVKSPLFDTDGQVSGLVGITRDITALKQAEDQRQALRAQLQQQQKLESLGTLAGGVAHEINNPITGIMSYAELIADSAEGDDPMLGYAGEIVAESKRIAEIVRNLLTFARDEKQSHSPALMSDLVNSTISLVQTIIRRDQITLEVDVPEDLPTIKCRSQHIRQVLMNLMTNARDALNERYDGYSANKIIRISTRLEDHEGRRWLRTTVEDHGIGIEKDVAERIFDPFFTTKARERGTGLGLSISHGIVTDHHGRLSVESSPGNYTRFYLDLPIENGGSLSGE